jgi:hypothetical protein
MKIKNILWITLLFVTAHLFAATSFPYKVTIKVEINNTPKTLVYVVQAENRVKAFDMAKDKAKKEIKKDFEIVHFSIVRND